jgi:hypothetical protein
MYGPDFRYDFYMLKHVICEEILEHFGVFHFKSTLFLIPYGDQSFDDYEVAGIFIQTPAVLFPFARVLFGVARTLVFSSHGAQHDRKTRVLHAAITCHMRSALFHAHTMVSPGV